MHLRTATTLAAVLAAAPLAIPTAANAVESSSATSQGCHTDPITLPGAYAKYAECVYSNDTTVRGAVRDTSLDGECAYIDVYFIGGGHRSDSACGSGETTYYSYLEHGASGAKVYLSEY